MKKTKIIYWIVTGLFSVFMLFTAIPNIMKTKESMEFMASLGYPDYFVMFIGVAKFVGIIAILIPGYPRIKEWAYAGLFFDLFGALYSIIAKEGFQMPVLFIILPIGFLFWSYFLFHKLHAKKSK
ncbi:MAG: DoxX family protein [Bacteroidetes bacterium]|nr:DoxX family protein [Bacteroidota bacterium]